MQCLPAYTCKRAALFSDIHANYHALLACVEDAKAQGADLFVFLGDYVSGLADPVKTMDLVYALQAQVPTLCIRGNRERSMLEHHTGVSHFVPGSNTGSYLFTYQQLRKQDLAFFAQLPIAAGIILNGIPVELAHAAKDNDRYLFEPGDEKIQGVFQSMNTAYLLAGHSHKQYRYCQQNKTIINPGSVGLPQGAGWHAQYALLDVENGAVNSTFRQVAYDMEALIHAQFQSGLVDMGRCWALCDLYGAMEGKEYTKALLTKIYQHAGTDQSVFGNEAVWDQYTKQLGIAFTEEAALVRFYLQQ